MVLTILAPAAAMALATPAGPGWIDAPPQIDVPTSDLNLAYERDRQKLDRRLKLAAERLCNRSIGQPSRAYRTMQRECLATAHASYQEQVRVAVAEATGGRFSLRAE